MNEFTVTIELAGCNINGAEYVRLDELMMVEGFKRRVDPLAGRIHPDNLSTNPNNLPHATYFGRSDQNKLTLQCHVESRIKEAIWPEVVVHVAEGLAII